MYIKIILSGIISQVTNTEIQLLDELEKNSKTESSKSCKIKEMEIFQKTSGKTKKH